MQLNRQQEPAILSSPFGSLIAAETGLSTRQAFAMEKFELIAQILERNANNGVTQPVTPTYAASQRGLNTDPSVEQELFNWNANAAMLVQTHFPHGKKPFGSIASVFDSDGKDDDIVRGLDLARFTRERHEAQLLALNSFGVQTALAEALRYGEEGVGLAQAADDAAMPRVILSYQTNGTGVPDQKYGTLTFDQFADHIAHKTRGNTVVQFALNCGNLDHIIETIERNPGLFVGAHPNGSIIPSGAEGDEFRRLAALNHQRTPDQQRRFDELRSALVLNQSHVQRLVDVALAHRLEYIGLCCGSTPEDASLIRAALDKRLNA